MTTTHSVPVALRQLTEGLADLHEAIRAETDIEACFGLAHELRPIVQAAFAIQTLVLKRADDLLKEK